MYYGNHIDGSLKLARHSIRHVSEITAIAIEFGNAKIIVPSSWLRKGVIVFLYSDFISKYPEE
jgi:hypothetical protein